MPTYQQGQWRDTFRQSASPLSKTTSFNRYQGSHEQERNITMDDTRATLESQFQSGHPRCFTQPLLTWDTDRELASNNPMKSGISSNVPTRLSPPPRTEVKSSIAAGNWEEMLRRSSHIMVRTTPDGPMHEDNSEMKLGLDGGITMQDKRAALHSRLQTSLAIHSPYRFLRHRHAEE